MAQNPDPSLPVTSLKGATRPLDDWSTMFHLVAVVLPDRPEGAGWIDVADQISSVIGDADCRVVLCVTGTPAITRRVVGDAVDRYLVLVDPDRSLVGSLGLERLPAIVHLRQDTTLVDSAEGWDPEEWQRVVDGVAAAMRWSVPPLGGPGTPRATAGWPA